MKPQLLFASIGIVVGVLIGYNFIYMPHQQQVQKIHRQIADEQKRQNASAQVASSLLRLESYRKRLPPEAASSWLIDQVLSASKVAGCSLSAIEPEAPQPYLQQLVRIGVRLQLKATYHQLGVFLDELERSGYWIRTEDLKISQAPQEGGAAYVQMTLGSLYLPSLL
ncbi:MAG: type 4a pilus biogenesis protein PilO [Candidatus Omnitrophica bacterium]|nr:type 4a pilus biogenesis protein PilO [Candidatus Omnitrophota bacterium]